MKEGRRIVCAFALLATGAGAAMFSCGGAVQGSGAQDAGGADATLCGYGGCQDEGGDGPPVGPGAAPLPCIDCVLLDCPGAPNGTTISGKVYDPAGKNPLYGVLVENPASDPIDLSRVHQGASCAACTSIYTTAVAYAFTDETGSFTIRHAASDSQGLPTTLVVQAGKWRSAYQVHVTACQVNSIPDGTLKLPSRVQAGNYSSMPQIAVSTGAADSLECLFHRMGIADSEFVAGAATGGHVHIFSAQNDGGAGAGVEGGSPDPGQNLWDTQAHLAQYDLVLFSCEGAETNGLTDSARTNLYDYANNGGRAFLSHYHYAWLTPTGPFSTLNPPIASWVTGAHKDRDPAGAVVSITIADGGPFPEGVSMGKWLTSVGATQNGELSPITNTYDNATVTSANPRTQVWLAGDDASANPGSAQYLSVDTPYAGGDTTCGRVVYSDLHASPAPAAGIVGVDYPGSPLLRVVPSGCADRDLTPQEKALEFMIFDLSSCLVPIGQDAGTPFPGF
jgi:hypothetical protein